jgi:hypothetical protein
MNKNIFILILFVILCFIFNYTTHIEKFDIYDNNNKLYNLPKGFWNEKCIILDKRGPFIWASCENDKGKLVNTSIDISKCYNHRIRNFNGILECL